MSNESKNEPRVDAKERAEVAVQRVEIPTYAPAIDVLEKDDEILVLADLPGALTEDVDVQYEDGQLTLDARIAPRARRGRPLLREYEAGHFHRTFRIGDGIDVERIAAEMKDGVLWLHLPKREALRSRRIPIGGGSTSSIEG